jgi:hypothetical protein
LKFKMKRKMNQKEEATKTNDGFSPEQLMRIFEGFKKTRSENKEWMFRMLQEWADKKAADAAKAEQEEDEARSLEEDPAEEAEAEEDEAEEDEAEEDEAEEDEAEEDEASTSEAEEDEHERQWIPKKKCLCCPHKRITYHTCEITQIISRGKDNQIKVILPEDFVAPPTERYMCQDSKFTISCKDINICFLGQRKRAFAEPMCFALKTNFPSLKDGIEREEQMMEIGHFSEDDLFFCGAIKNYKTSSELLLQLTNEFKRCGRWPSGRNGGMDETHLDRVDNLIFEIVPLTDGPFTPFEVTAHFLVKKQTIKMQPQEDGNYEPKTYAELEMDCLNFH